MELKTFTALDLRNTQVADAGLQDLKKLKSLTSLNIGRTHVTDGGSQELKELKNLTALHVWEPRRPTRDLRDLMNWRTLCRNARFPDSSGRHVRPAVDSADLDDQAGRRPGIPRRPLICERQSEKSYKKINEKVPHAAPIK
jgi:hypothetical protein